MSLSLRKKFLYKKNYIKKYQKVINFKENKIKSTIKNNIIYLQIN